MREGNAMLICSTCKYHHEMMNGEWICTNTKSECMGYETDFGDWCEDWEEHK